MALDKFPDYVEGLGCLGRLLHQKNRHQLGTRLEYLASCISQGQPLTAAVFQRMVIPDLEGLLTGMGILQSEKKEYFFKLAVVGYLQLR